MSGIFLAALVRHLPAFVDWRVLTPCGSQPPAPPSDLVEHLYCFRYGPWRWQQLAHAAGGLPAALSRPANLALLPLFLPAMFIASFRVSRQVDLVHANWSPIGLIAGLAAGLAGTPCITTLRGSDIDLAERRRSFRWILHACASLNRRLVCVGSSVAQRAASMLGVDERRLSVIPNGIPASFFAVPAAQPTPCLRILALGSLVLVKRLDILIRALALLPETCHVSIVGAGPERDRLFELVAELGLGARVDFLGARRPSEIPALMSDHDVLVLASRAEGRPNAVLEAMAAGRTVVASDIPAVREIIRDGETGSLFPVGDAEALAQRLSQLFADPDLRVRFGDAARQSVAHLTWQAAGESYAALYAEVLGGSNETRASLTDSR